MANRNRRGRPIDGIFVLDKSVGHSSNKVLQIVKSVFKAQKAGHTGSLDPLASGVLPICLGEATKFSQFLLDADKVYETTAKLGVSTTTGDAEGEIVAEKVVELEPDQINDVLSQFLGVQDQLPSMYSALKHNGQPLYKLARKGIEVEREARQIEIKALDFLGLEGDELRMRVHCSKGTYIRTLVQDIGDVLGCGAHVIGLHRTMAGPFAEMVNLESLFATRDQGGLEAIDKLLLPMESAVSTMPGVDIDASKAYYLKQGQKVEAVIESEIVTKKAQNPAFSGFEVRIFEKSEGEKHFIGVGSLSAEGELSAKRLLKTN